MRESRKARKLGTRYTVKCVRLDKYLVKVMNDDPVVTRDTVYEGTTTHCTLHLYGIEQTGVVMKLRATN